MECGRSPLVSEYSASLGGAELRNRRQLTTGTRKRRTGNRNWFQNRSGRLVRFTTGHARRGARCYSTARRLGLKQRLPSNGKNELATEKIKTDQQSSGLDEL